MKRANLTDGQQRLHTCFSEAGGVVQFVFFDCGGDALDERIRQLQVTRLYFDHSDELEIAS